tara:strand:- start:2453 stop:3229 length:777 start_codon:yes stop_codon:yes gene_type:complete
LNEAIASAYARAVSDGAPGLARLTYIGTTLGDYTASGWSGTAGTDFLVISSSSAHLTVGIYPGDIAELDGNKFLVTSLVANKIYIGAPLQASISSGTITVSRRSVPLASVGHIIRVADAANSGSRGTILSHDPDAVIYKPFEKGSVSTSMVYSQVYDGENTEKSMVQFWPCPPTGERFTIIQSSAADLLDADGDWDSSAAVYFPEPALDAILERARLIYLTWTSEQSQVVAAMAQEAVKDVSDELQNTSNPVQIFRRG